MRDDQNGTISERTSGVLVVEVHGELDIAVVVRWTALVEAAFCELPEPHLLVLDLTELEFLTARAGRALLEAIGGCRGRGIAGCLIVVPGSIVDRVVRVAGIADRVPVFPNRLTAIAACQPVEMRWFQT
jgi:anti-anti-sigma factor